MEFQRNETNRKIYEINVIFGKILIKDLNMKYLLAIDIGNTNTVLGIMDKGKVLHSWRVTTGNLQTEDELGILILSMLHYADFTKEDISLVGIASVVPNVTGIYQKISEKYFGLTPFIVGSHLNLKIKIKYEDPKAVGADRICNVVAAYEKYGGPGIVIDFGTATTYDVYDEKGNYLGGNIAPGIETSAYALHQRTAKLPKIDLKLPEKIIAANTTESMQNGILLGALDSMEGMVKRISKQLNSAPVLTLTGGISRFIKENSKLKFHLEPDLVLEGIYRIGKRDGLMK